MKYIWKTIKPIGSGGQGDAFLVEKEGTSEKAVMKTLRDRWKGNSQAISRMNSEIDILIKLQNTKAIVPKVLDRGTNEDPFYVMEFINGIRADEYIKDCGKLKLSDSVEFVECVAKTIDVCHSLNIVHRDLKPGNLILRSGKFDDIVVIDFGISFDSMNTFSLTNTGEIFWNEFIRLPECQDLVSNSRDVRSDITCLCGLLFYLVFGHPPAVLIDASGLMPHQRPDTKIGKLGLSPAHGYAIEGIFNKGFQNNIDLRFQSMSDFLNTVKILKASGEKEIILDPISEMGALNSELMSRDKNTIHSALKKLYQTSITNVSIAIQAMNAELQKKGGSLEIRGNHSVPVGTDGLPDEVQQIQSDISTYRITAGQLGYIADVNIGGFISGNLIAVYMQRQISKNTNTRKGTVETLTPQDVSDGDLGKWRFVLNFTLDDSQDIQKDKAKNIVQTARQSLAVNINSLRKLVQ